MNRPYETPAGIVRQGQDRTFMRAGFRDSFVYPLMSLFLSSYSCLPISPRAYRLSRMSLADSAATTGPARHTPMAAHHEKAKDHHGEGDHPPPTETVPGPSVSKHHGYLPSFLSAGSQTSTFLSSTSKLHFSSRMALNFLRARCRRTFTFSTVSPRMSAIS